MRDNTQPLAAHDVRRLRDSLVRQADTLIEVAETARPENQPRIKRAAGQLLLTAAEMSARVGDHGSETEAGR